MIIRFPITKKAALIIDKQMIDQLSEDELDAGISNLLAIVKDRLPKTEVMLLSSKDSLPDHYTVNHHEVDLSSAEAVAETISKH